MKKVLSAILAAAVLMLSGCAKKESAGVLKDGQSDIEYVQGKGTFKIGVTDYAPMDFPDGENWDGFDAKLAVKFAEELGVTPEFVEIDWDKKTDLLTDGTIDTVWNGMTLTDELKKDIDCTSAYLSNSQVIVMNSDKIGDNKTLEDCQHLLFAVEDGSAGEEILTEKKYRYTTFATQKDALDSVVKGTSDCAVIDIIMAGYFTADGGDFSELAYALPLNEEEIGIGFRKGSDLTAKANDFLKEMAENGEMGEIAKEYGIDGAIL